jgi:hypothetical protein
LSPELEPLVPDFTVRPLDAAPSRELPPETRPAERELPDESNDPELPRGPATASAPRDERDEPSEIRPDELLDDGPLKLRPEDMEPEDGPPELRPEDMEPEDGPPELRPEDMEPEDSPPELRPDDMEGPPPPPLPPPPPPPLPPPPPPPRPPLSPAATMSGLLNTMAATIVMVRKRTDARIFGLLFPLAGTGFLLTTMIGEAVSCK